MSPVVWIDSWPRNFCTAFKFHVLRQHLHGDPTLPIERAKKRFVHRETFSADERSAVIASNLERAGVVAVGSIVASSRA
jgi:hypothetical protein